MISGQNDDSGWVSQHRSNTVVIGSGGEVKETHYGKEKR
jgi:hypothetical protein